MFPGLEPRAKLPSLFVGIANIWTAVQTFSAGFITSAVSTLNAALRGGVVTLSSSGNSIAINAAAGNYFAHTFTEDTDLANPSNLAAGQMIVIAFTQHASSPKTLTYGSYWKFAGGTAPTITATAGAADTLVGYVRSATHIDTSMLNDMS